MVEDYLSDREQEEALRGWWRENRNWILSGVVLGLALLGGWRYWETHRAQRADLASKVYADFRAALAKPDIEQAGRLLQDLAAEHDDAAYTQQARLLLAKAEFEAGKLDQAQALLREVADKSKDKELAQIARLRGARVLIQQGKHDEALAQLNVESAGAFVASVRELRGDALLAKGDSNAARAEYSAALKSGDDPLAGARINRELLELKLQEVGGDAEKPAAETAAAAVERGQP